MRRKRPRRLYPAALATLAVALACSCARRGVPPGGPVDSDPPRVVSTSPDSGRVRVGTASGICVTFSEPMDKRTVRDAVTIRPTVKVGDMDWRKNSFCLTPAESLDTATTYAVTLMSGCKDSHGNAAKEPYAFTFSTGDSVARGVISGVVTAKTLPAPGIPVWAFDSVRTPLPDFAKDAPQYVSQAGSKGEFRFLGLPSGTYLLFAFKDKDANRAYDDGSDFTSPAPEAARVTAGDPVVTDVQIALVDPKEPGGVRGVVHHCFVDSVVIAVTAVSVTDTAASFSTSAGRDSSFSMGDMPAGRYTVTCFFDRNTDGVRDPGEIQCREPHTIQVTPGDVVSGVTLELPCPELRMISGTVSSGPGPGGIKIETVDTGGAPEAADTTAIPAKADTTTTE